jgi:hypothetical protein
VLTLYGALFVVLGFLMDTPEGILRGLRQIILEPDFLITDYIGVGGLGAAFVNAGILTLAAIFILYRMEIKVTGATISTVWLMTGFGLFGKNIFNVWFIMAGVWLYAQYQKDKFIKYVYIGLFGTSLAPLVTQIMFITNMSRWVSIPLGMAVGVFVGFILPPVSAYLMRVHQGFNLYNIGFTAGIIGTITVSVLRSYGLNMETRMIWTTGNNQILAMILVALFALMILIGFYLNGKSMKGYKNFYKYSGRLVTDFVILEGFAPSLLNMGINGLFATAYVLAIRGDLNGPSLGGIFTIVGFSAFGKHLGNMLPIFIGVFLGSLTKVWYINDPSIVLAALFGTTLAPIAGEFGWKYGILAGFLHSSVVLNVGFLHGGINLYNNGFAGGIVAATLIPIIEAFKKEE